MCIRNLGRFNPDVFDDPAKHKYGPVFTDLLDEL